jgi:hypothetical protein
LNVCANGVEGLRQFKWGAHLHAFLVSRG